MWIPPADVWGNSTGQKEELSQIVGDPECHTKERALFKWHKDRLCNCFAYSAQHLEECWHLAVAQLASEE